ncbi:CBO0543 family protein [Paenibacillus alginolyticus]|uniref:Uncharacterized protein n=1 Tax=Paenibacillus alginolyticus TaxID=59839 RepID=A0ABT4G567_9BACL|nr:CBO0543 family protein [Paenibacillus alginolyticus]MCY9691321.1 hypothetical protein [Paenibacillus alginolyticus]MEC0147994.1 hypothetical protein [Paenibacillus alginolyticus]
MSLLLQYGIIVSVWILSLLLILIIPRQKRRLAMVALFTTVLTIVEVLLVQYTDLIRYVRWNWFWSWATIFLTFLITRVFCVVYFGTMTRVEAAKKKNAASTTRS